MKHDLIVSKSIDINASIGKVWEALTNPTIIKEYLFGTETVTTWKPGSEIIFQGDYEGQKYKDKGVVVENVPELRLSYRYWSGFSGTKDKPENYSLVIYNLADKGNNETLLTWTQVGFPNEENHKHSADGMDAFLQSIKTVIEK